MFWLFMLVMDLLIPLMMIVFGKIFMKKSPRSINPVFGYRTTMSMKNRDTWEFAHRCCGRLWWRWGLAMLVLTIVPFLFLTGSREDTVSIVGGIICFVQLIPLIGTVFMTERALKRTFDRDGNRVNPPVQGL